ncbi:MAG: S-layer homology domain-containing protein [Ruminiclostridium sp.]
MAAVGGLVGVAGSPVVNCYTMGDTISEDYSFYVGATIGWATGIAEVYDVYYSKEANQSIQNEKVSPVSEIGLLVGQGINEEGEVYPGALTYNIEGMTSEMIKSQSLADKLNANFDAFPLNTDVLPANIQLKKWMVKDGVVTFSEEYAARTYVAPAVEKPILTGNYYDGTFYGRAENTAENSYVMVTIEVKDKKITSIKSDTEIEGINSVIETVLQTNQAPNIENSDSVAMIGFKNALRRATIKALKGDYTDYSSVNPYIFEGGDGSKANPYKIANSNQLVKFAAAINEVEHFKDKYIILTGDIDLSGIQWVPAGGRGLYPFSGNFDGKGHTVSHMEIGGKTEPAKYTCAGLFAHTDTATISNLSVKDGYIHTKPSSIPGVDSERTYTGLLVGYAGLTDTSGTRGTTIDNCYVTGQIISNSVESNYVGGLAGTIVHSLLSNSYSNCVIEASSSENWVYTGGLVGLPAFSILVNNIVYGKIHTDSAVNKTQIGGIGGMYSSYAFNNYTDVNLNTEKQTADIGEIAGRITGIGYIGNCFGNLTSEQKTGNKVLTGINTVGTIVTGDRYGKGQIQKSELMAAIDQNLINKLNQNISLMGKDSMYTDLVREWSIYIPENFKYNTWTLNNGKIVFATAQTDSSSGGGSSAGVSGGSSSSDKVDIVTDYKAKAFVSQGSASATVKVNDIRESKSLKIESSIANIVFDENALKEIFTKAGAELSTNINILEKSSLSQTLQDIVGDRPVYDITLKSGDKIISDFGSGTVSVEIPYTLREGEAPAGIIVYYMDDQGKLTKMTTSYNSDTKKVTFKTNHFSKYIVRYDTVAAATQNMFTDVSEKVWYAEAVLYVFKSGIMNGESDTAFNPNASSTRAMVCTAFWNMEKKPTQTAESRFKDVLNNSWYAQPVIWASEQGITKGISESSFAPNTNVTREQFAQFLYNYAKYKGYTLGQATDLSKYKDMPSASAKNAVMWAVGNEIISGKGNGMLDLQGIATRAEIAQMIMKFNKKYSIQ